MRDGVFTISGMRVLGFRSMVQYLSCWFVGFATTFVHVPLCLSNNLGKEEKKTGSIGQLRRTSCCSGSLVIMGRNSSQGQSRLFTLNSLTGSSQIRPKMKRKPSLCSETKPFKKEILAKGYILTMEREQKNE